MDGLFAFVLFTAMLFISDLATIGAALFSLAALGYIAMRRSQWREILAPRVVFLLIPVFTILSILWSSAPVDSAKYALEFVVTVGIGLLLSAAPRPKAILWGMFPAFGLYVVIALISGQTVGVGNSGETAFSGLTDSKNLLADISATGLLVSLACCVAGIEGRRMLLAVLTLLVATLQVYTLIEARSAGALIGLAPGVAVFVFLLMVRHVRLMVRLIISAFCALGLAFVVFVYSEIAGGLLAAALTVFAKDPTLTGRTYLWQRAGDFIAEDPLLGKGFGAFWLQGNLDAEGLWRYAGITERSGFNFHDTAIEILVHLGWIGLTLFALVAVIGFVRLLSSVMLRPSLSLCFWFSLTIYEMARMPFESVGVTPFFYSTVVLFIAFGSSFASRKLAPVAKRQRRVPYQPYRPGPVTARTRWAES
jgi:exopolysaccharide production protein ExoQ